MSSQDRMGPGWFIFACVVIGIAGWWAFKVGIPRYLHENRSSSQMYSELMTGSSDNSTLLLVERSERDPKAAFYVGVCRWRGGCSGIEQKPEEAVQIWQRIAERVPEAAFNVGYCYEFGMGVPQDTDKAKEFYRLGSDLPAAAWRLGSLLESFSPQEALRFYSKAAAREENPLLAYKIGWLHYTGAAGVKNVTEAQKWFTKAAKVGILPEALFMLGYIHLESKAMLTPDDRVYAGSWFVMAAHVDKDGVYAKKTAPFLSSLSSDELAKAKEIAGKWLSAQGMPSAVNTYDSMFLALK